MTVQDVLELHRVGWSREEVLAMMREQPQPQETQPQPQETQPQPQEPQHQPQPQKTAQQEPQQPQQPQQPQPQPQEGETVQLLREMLGMIRGNNINTLGGESRSVDAAEILAANDYGFDKGGKT